MKLIDTSSWIHGLRTDGNPEVAARVRALLESGEACWCSIIRLELWNGARGRHEKHVLEKMEDWLPELEISREVWNRAYGLAQKARVKGHTIPATDILIAACARHYEVGIEHSDAHFDIVNGL